MRGYGSGMTQTGRVSSARDETLPFVASEALVAAALCAKYISKYNNTTIGYPSLAVP